MVYYVKCKYKGDDKQSCVLFTQNADYFSRVVEQLKSGFFLSDTSLSC